MYYYKLTATELEALVPADAACILRVAAERKPGKFAREVVRVPLNKAGTIWVQNTHYYGGENFGEPYHFPAEICHVTTNSAFIRFVNKRNLHLRIPISY